MVKSRVIKLESKNRKNKSGTPRPRSAGLCILHCSRRLWNDALTNGLRFCTILSRSKTNRSHSMAGDVVVCCKFMTLDNSRSVRARRKPADCCSIYNKYIYKWCSLEIYTVLYNSGKCVNSKFFHVNFKKFIKLYL